MKKTFLLFIALMGMASISFSQHHYIKITLDTKLMDNTNCSLGANGYAYPSPCDTVYASLGLCTCALDTAFIAQCGNPVQDSIYCNSQILPFHSNIWQHIVGPLGFTPPNNGIGLMDTLGNGVYSLEFCIEDYFTNPALVDTLPYNGIGGVSSTVWNPLAGGAPYTIGMVFRNEDASLLGRDDMCKDLFIVGINEGAAHVIQGWDGVSSFPAVTVVTIDSSGYCLSGFDEINHNSIYISAYPNPFNEQTQIVYTLTEQSNDLNITVFNSLGQEVEKLYSGRQSSGSHSVIWNGTDNHGNALPSGVYYYTMTSDNKMIASQKMVISR